MSSSIDPRRRREAHALGGAILVSAAWIAAPWLAGCSSAAGQAREVAGLADDRGHFGGGLGEHEDLFIVEDARLDGLDYQHALEDAARYDGNAEERPEILSGDSSWCTMICGITTQLHRHCSPLYSTTARVFPS